MTLKAFKPFKLIIIVILVLIILFFIINDKKEHLINNSEVEKSFQTLAQLLSSNKLSVKPVDANTDISKELENIAINVDKNGRIQGYLPSNIVYDNGKYRDVNNKFTINTDGTFSSTDFVFQEGVIKNSNNSVLYDPVTKKLKYNKVTYDGVNNKLEENNKKYNINQEGDITSEGINYLYNNNTFTTPFVSYDINTKILKQKDNLFTIDNIGNFNAGGIIYEEQTGNMMVKDLVYNKNTDKITKGSEFIYDTDKNLSLNDGDLLYTVDGTIKKNNQYEINKEGIVTAENFKFENDKISVGNLDYDLTKQNEIIFGEDIMYNFDDKVIKKIDDSVIIEQDGKIMARKNNDGYDFTYDITGDIKARDLVYAESGDITARDLVYKSDNEITARNDFVYTPNNQITARGLVYQPNNEINARDFKYFADGSIYARDFFYKPDKGIVTGDISFENNILKKIDNSFEYNTTTKVFNADYLGKNANGTNKYNLNMDNKGNVKVYPNTTNTAYDVNYYKQYNNITMKDLTYDLVSNKIIKAGPNFVLYDVTNNIFKALPDSYDRYNFVMDKGVIQAQYNPTSNTYYFKSDGKTLNFKPNPKAPGTYEVVHDGTNTKIRDLIYENDLLRNQSNTFKYDTNKNAVDVGGTTVTRYMLDNNTGNYKITRGTLTDISDDKKIIPEVYTFNKFGTLIDSPNFYDEVIIMKNKEDTNNNPLHIRKVFLYDMNGYTGTAGSIGTLIPASDLTLFSENMGSFTKDNLLVDSTNPPMFNGHGLGTGNVNEVIRIKLTTPRKLASIRIDNRIDCCQSRIHKTIVYFRKNNITLAKIELKAPTDSSGKINIIKDTPLNSFPMYIDSIETLRKRGRTVHEPYLLEPTNSKTWMTYGGPSVWRFFGTGLYGTTFYNLQNGAAGGGNWSGSLYGLRPYVVLPVPTVAGTLDEKDDYK